MQKQFNKINLISLMQTILYKTDKVFLSTLLVLVASISVWANPGKGAKDKEQMGTLLSNVTTDPSSLFFSAVENHPSDSKQA